MAKSHKAKVPKFCVRLSWPVYGEYDEIAGWRSKTTACSRSERQAQAEISRLIAKYDDDGAGAHFYEVVKRVPGQRDAVTRVPQKSWPRPRRFRDRIGF